MKQEEEKVYLDLVPFLARAIARQPAARGELDAIFGGGSIAIPKATSPKMPVYNRYYRESDLQTELYCHKATDLVLAALQGGGPNNPALTALEQVLKKCWRPVYGYVKGVKGQDVPFAPLLDQIVVTAAAPTECELRNLPDWRPALLKKGAVMSKNTLDGEFPVFLFLVNSLGKSNVTQDRRFRECFEAHLKEQKRMHRNPKTTPILTEPQKKLAAALWQGIEQQLRGIPANINEYFYTREYERILRTSPWTYDNFHGLPLSAIKHTPVSRQELKRAIERLAVMLPAATEVTDGLRQTALEYFKHIMLIRACATQHEQLRSFALQQTQLANKEPVRQRQVTKLKAQLVLARQKNRELETLLAQRQEKPLVAPLLQQKQTALNDLQLKLEKNESAAQKEIARLQARLAAEQEVNQALTGLLTAEKPHYDETADLSPAILAQIALLNVILVGGRTDWQQRLKSKYPNFSFIAAEDVKFDLAVLAAADVIVINWKYLGHSLSYRTLSYAGKYNKRIIYLRSSNEKHLLQALYRECILPME